MFEDALMESGGRIKTKSKYFTFVGIVLNGSIVAALILIPLIYPEALPKAAMSTLLVAPPPPPPPPPAPVHIQKVVSEMLNNQLTAPTKIPKDIKMVKDDSPPAPAGAGVAGMDGMAGGAAGGIGSILGGIGTGPAPVVKAAAPKKIAVSAGVMSGSKISGSIPPYPPIAKAARIQGTVVLQATISKSGTIENLHVLSGPPMLQQSAMDAVRTWRYRPYLLNGEPVEVETQINVIFTLGG